MGHSAEWEMFGRQEVQTPATLPRDTFGASGWTPSVDLSAQKEDRHAPADDRGRAFGPAPPLHACSGAGEGTRTLDPLLGKQMLY